MTGSNFAFVGIMSEIFNISHQSYIEGFSKYPVSSNLLLFQSGPLAPLSLIVLGIVLLRTRSVQSSIAILVMLGGITFLLGLIFCTPWVAHITDALPIVLLAILGLRILTGKRIS